MAINTNADNNMLGLRDIIRASGPLLATRNSKGRIAPVHIQGPPGVGQTIRVNLVAKAAARRQPGVPYGMITFNPGVSQPSDIPGFVLFDTLTHPEGHPRAGTKERVATYTRPAMFQVSKVFLADVGGDITEVHHDINSQPVYVGSVVSTPTGPQPVNAGIILLDEYMQADAEVRKILAPLLDEGRVATHELPPDWAVWACSNRAKDQSGTGKAMAFLTNRVITLEMEQDLEALIAYGAGGDVLSSLEVLHPLTESMPGSTWHAVVQAYLAQNAETVFAGVPLDPGQPFMTPRSLELLAHLFDSFCVTNHHIVDDDTEEGEARHRLFLACASGAVGSDNATQFETTVRLWGKVPTIEEIIADPMKANMPREKDAQLIAAWQVSNRMTLSNGERLMTYMERDGMTEAFVGNAIIGAVTRDGSLLGVPRISRHFQKNPNAMVRMVEARNAGGRTRQAARH